MGGCAAKPARWARSAAVVSVRPDFFKCILSSHQRHGACLSLRSTMRGNVPCRAAAPQRGCAARTNGGSVLPRLLQEAAKRLIVGERKAFFARSTHLSTVSVHNSLRFRSAGNNRSMQGQEEIGTDAGRSAGLPQTPGGGVTTVDTRELTVPIASPVRNAQGKPLSACWPGATATGCRGASSSSMLRAVTTTGPTAWRRLRTICEATSTAATPCDLHAVRRELAA